jgi:hypothetical protein
MREPTNLFVKLRPTPSGEGSVNDHKAIATKHGTVWWGRWSSASSSRRSIINTLNDQIDRGLEVQLLVRNAVANIEVSARILQIETPGFTPPPHLVPKYRDTPQVDMWLRLSSITDLPLGWIASHCSYASGRLEGQPVHYRGTQSLQYVVIDR